MITEFLNSLKPDFTFYLSTINVYPLGDSSYYSGEGEDQRRLNSDDLDYLRGLYDAWIPKITDVNLFLSNPENIINNFQVFADHGYIPIDSPYSRNTLQTQDTINWYNATYKTSFRNPLDYLAYLYGGGSIEFDSRIGNVFVTPGNVPIDQTVNPPLTYFNDTNEFMQFITASLVVFGTAYAISNFMPALTETAASTTTATATTAAESAATTIAETAASTSATVSGADLAALVESGTTGIEGAFLESAALSDAAVTYSTVSGELLSMTLPTGEVISYDAFVNTAETPMVNTVSDTPTIEPTDTAPDLTDIPTTNPIDNLPSAPSPTTTIPKIPGTNIPMPSVSQIVGAGSTLFKYAQQVLKTQTPKAGIPIAMNSQGRKVDAYGNPVHTSSYLPLLLMAGGIFALIQ